MSEHGALCGERYVSVREPPGGTKALKWKTKNAQKDRGARETRILSFCLQPSLNFSKEKEISQYSPMMQMACSAWLRHSAEMWNVRSRAQLQYGFNGFYRPVSWTDRYLYHHFSGTKVHWKHVVADHLLEEGGRDLTFKSYNFSLIFNFSQYQNKWYHTKRDMQAWC